MKQTWVNGFLHLAAPITLFLIILWAYFLWKFVKTKWSWKDNWQSFAISLFGASWAFSSTQVGFKVLSDETNLLSVANMIIQFGMASNTEQWLYYYHTYHPLDFSVPSRPIFFPLLTAIVHSVNGMKAWSPFVVNFFALWAMFFLFIRELKFPFGKWMGFLALLMSPVLLIVSTSAGFDLCSLFFGYLTFLLWQKWIKSQDNGALLALYFSLLCFASVRYESIVILPLFLLFVWRKNRVSLIPMCIGVICVIPLLVQRGITWGTFENPSGVPAFSPVHFLKYFPEFLKAFFWNFNGVYPILLHWLGILGLLHLISRWRREYFFPLSYLCFLLVLLLSHHFGIAGHPTQVRLFLPISFALTGLALYAIKEFQFNERLVVLIFALFSLFHLQYSVSDPLSTQLTMTREMRHIRDFHNGAEPNDLFIYDRPGQISALGFSSISHHYFRENREKVLGDYKRRLYQNIYFIDRPKYNENNLDAEGLKLKPLVEHQLSPEERLRISKIELSALSI
jgi:hypothetical protein